LKFEKMSYNPFNLENKTVLITGASSGIGRAIAIECSKAGANIIITGRDEIKLSETFNLLLPNPNHQIIVADLINQHEIDKLTDSICPLNGLVNCAGILNKLPLKYINEKHLDSIMQVNFYGPALLSQKLIKKKKLVDKASIVFISSISSNVATLGSIAYMASKGAINSMAKGMALELSGKGIRVNCIEPGFIRTKLNEFYSVEDLVNYEAKHPLGRFGNPEEIAYTAIYLLSNATEWMTGSVIKIDGGITLR